MQGLRPDGQQFHKSGDLQVAAFLESGPRCKSNFSLVLEELKNNLHLAVLGRPIRCLQDRARFDTLSVFVTTHSSVVIDLFRMIRNRRFFTDYTAARPQKWQPKAERKRDSEFFSISVCQPAADRRLRRFTGLAGRQIESLLAFFPDFVGEIRFGKIRKCMKQGELWGFWRSKAIGCSHAQFRFVVKALDRAR
ncbi:MAG: hypothetical protein JSS02_24620 [Planctomycetes bacterium]|nr:hypothetical protein [Planctomycetota bacterium]